MDHFVTTTKETLDELIEQTSRNENGTARKLIHSSHSETVQEMIIVFGINSWNKPNRSPKKSESLIILRGEMILVTLDDQGNLLSELQMGVLGSGLPFHYRIENVGWHFMIPTTEILIISEFISGPFEQSNFEKAPEWLPQTRSAFISFVRNLGLNHGRM